MRDDQDSANHDSANHDNAARKALQNLWTVRAAIAREVRHYGRAEHAVTLIAVSKTMPAEVIAPLITDGGQRIFGENRVQEAQNKWPALRALALAQTPESPVELHLIGPLQTNKIDAALDTFDVIETLDREKLAKMLANAIGARGEGFVAPRMLIEINTGAETQKAGVLPAHARDFIAFCKSLELPVEGLMCIPPAHAPPSPHFALLARLALENGLKTLSMGMSADYAAAIQLGATHVRLGSVIFGARH